MVGRHGSLAHSACNMGFPLTFSAPNRVYEIPSLIGIAQICTSSRRNRTFETGVCVYIDIRGARITGVTDHWPPATRTMFAPTRFASAARIGGYVTWIGDEVRYSQASSFPTNRLLPPLLTYIATSCGPVDSIFRFPGPGLNPSSQPCCQPVTLSAGLKFHSS